MPTLKEHWATARKHSTSVSNVARQLAFAGIAIVWVFRMTQGEEAKRIVIPKVLVWILACFAASLLCDLLQYVSLWVSWLVFARTSEMRTDRRYLWVFKGTGRTAEEDFLVPTCVNRGGYIFMRLKLLFLGIGYVLLVYFLINGGMKGR